MSDETDEVQSENEESGGNTYNDNSVHHGANLWPIAVAVLILALSFGIAYLVNCKTDETRVPYGKAYAAVGNIVDCQLINTPNFSGGTYTGNSDYYRSYIRTPHDEVFSVYWRGGHQPPPFGNAIGTVKYHECGVQGGNAVHCFDSFTFSGEGAKPLDPNGKPVEPTKAKP